MNTSFLSSAALRKELGRQLRIKRLNRDEKLTSVAASTGIDYSVICRIERGTYNSLNLETVTILTNYYQCKLAVLIS